MANQNQGRAIRKRTLMLTQLGLLTAIIFVFEVTNIGFIMLPPLSLTIMMVPVIIGGITMGKTAGAVLGGIFGITSLMQCFGKNPLGAIIFDLNPILTIVLLFGIRVLTGYLTALIYQVLRKFDKGRLWSYFAAGLAGSVLNTILYMSGLTLFFGTLPAMQEAFGVNAGSLVSAGDFFIIAMGVILVNFLIEAVVCAVIGGTAAKVLDKTINKL